MTNKIQKRLTKIINKLDDIAEEVEIKIEELERKQEAIINKVDGHYRIMTSRERARYDDLQDDIDELEYLRENVEDALDYIREYKD